MNTEKPEVVESTNWGDEQVHSQYISHAKGKISHATPVAGRMSHAQWSTTENRESPPSSESPHDVIRGLIVGRIFPAEFFAALGDKDLLPIMSACEVLELVGAASPTALHLAICAEVLREHVGEPKVIWGQERWLVAPRFNAEELPSALAKSFPIPENEKFQAVHPLLQAAGPAKRQLKLVPATKLYSLERPHAEGQSQDKG